MYIYVHTYIYNFPLTLNYSNALISLVARYHKIVTLEMKQLETDLGGFSRGKDGQQTNNEIIIIIIKILE